MKRVIVIGGGIAGHAVLFSLAQRANVDRFEAVTLLASDAAAPATSLRSTAVAALRGTQVGFSPLGDELVAQWEYAHTLLLKESFSGAELVSHQTCCYSFNTAKRFSHLPKSTATLPLRLAPELIVEEPAWVIDPAIFLSSIQQRCRNLGVHTIHHPVTQLTQNNGGWSVRLHSGEVLEAEQVILASGFWMHWMREYLVGTPLADLVPVQGSYYQWESQELSFPSFSVSLEGTNLIYSAPLKRLILGATSVKHDVSFVPDYTQLNELVEDISEKLLLELPPLSQAKIITGIRAQTRARMPWAGSLAPGLSAIGGLYKNGWVSAWKLADELVKSL